MHRLFPFLIAVFMLIAACQNRPEAVDSQQAQKWQKAWLAYRAHTDSLFKNADWSPIPAQQRAAFTHLNYYEYDPSWRLILILHRYAQAESVTVSGTKSGDLRPALRYGYFEFKHQGQPCRLEVIKILPHGKYKEADLFLGFWDKTSGSETYAGGRYVDLKPLGNDRYLVDFNYAYNPYCAYSHRYSCAIPPLQNRLPVAVRAGEKKYENHRNEKDHP